MLRTILWRMVAVLALLLYVLLAFWAVWLVARNFVFALVLALTFGVVLYAGWLVFTSGDRARGKGKWLLLGAAAALAAELIYFIRHLDDIWALLTLLAVTIIYIELAGLLRRKYWSRERQIAQATLPTAHFSNPYLIINPKSGNGRAIKAQIPEQAEALGIHVLQLTKGDDVAAVARQAAKAGADVLGISGGDGSIGAVAKVAIEHGLPMVVLPGGTRCHFARDIGLDPKRISDALAGFSGVKREIDIGSINGRIFLNNASFGMYGDMVGRPGYRDNKLRVARAVLQDLVSGATDRYDLRFRHGRQHFDKAVLILVGVNCYQTFNLFELGQRPRLDGGVLQISAVTHLDDEVVRRLMEGRSIPDFQQWTTRSFTVTSGAGSLVVGVDGEREDYATPVTVKIMPAALTIYVPAEGERNRPRSALSLLFARRVWQSLTAE